MTGEAHPRPSSIRVYLAEGKADGLRLVEKSNWTGLAMVASRTDYLRVRRREEWSRSGVYFLTGPAAQDTLRDLLYVGEADDVRDRVDNHVKNKDFWTTVIAFTSKDDNLNKAHVRYLEARLLQLAVVADRFLVFDGSLARASTVPSLHLGIRAQRQDQGVAATPERKSRLRPHLLPWSATRRGGSPFLRPLRDQLIAEGVLAPDGAHLRFTKTHLCNSPSTAAAVVGDKWGPSALHTNNVPWGRDNDRHRAEVAEHPRADPSGPVSRYLPVAKLLPTVIEGLQQRYLWC